MKDQIQSASPEGLGFAIIHAMPNELSPLIQLLKKWRTANDLTQAQAVAAFHAQGLPVAGGFRASLPPLRSQIF